MQLTNKDIMDILAIPSSNLTLEERIMMDYPIKIKTKLYKKTQIKRKKAIRKRSSTRRRSKKSQRKR